MRIPKKYIVILGIIIIWLFALLNRIHVYNISETTSARAYKSILLGKFVLVFKYKGITYEKLFEKDHSLEDSRYYKLLIKRGNPNNFILFTFWGFLFDAMIVSGFITLVWLIFVQVFFEDIESFQLSSHKNGRE
jgi:hypothetical protein